MGGDISNSQQLEEIKKIIAGSTSRLDNSIENLKKNLKEHIEVSSAKIDKLEQENKELREKVEFLEKVSRQKNIVIFGLKSELKGLELAKWAVAQINSLLGVNILLTQITNIYFKGDPDTKPLVIAFINTFTRELVLKNSNKLKGKKIFIRPDLTSKDQKIHKLLFTNLKEAKKNSSNAYIKRQKLYVDGEEYTYEELLGNDPATINNRQSNYLSSPSITKQLSLSAPGTPTPIFFGSPLGAEKRSPNSAVPAEILQKTTSTIETNNSPAVIGGDSAIPDTKTENKSIKQTQKQAEDKKRTVSNSTPQSQRTSSRTRTQTRK